jgi:MFS transporter, DHA3 family, macrolide efflux protein
VAIPAEIATSAALTAVAALPPFLTGDETQLQRTNSVVEGAAGLAFVAGGAVGGLVAHLFSVDAVFVVDAVTSVIAVALVTPVRLRSVAAGERGSPFAELREGFRFSYSSRPIRLYLMVGAFLWMGFGTFAALEPLFFRDILGTSPEALGWINSVFGAGLIAGSALLSRLPASLTSARNAAVGAIGSGLGAIAYTGSTDLRLVALGVGFWGLVLGLLLPLLRTLTHYATPDGLLGRVMGVYLFHNTAGELVPLTFVPALAAIWGVQAVLVGSGVVVIAVALATLPEAHAIDRLGITKPAARRTLEPVDEPISPNP